MDRGTKERKGYPSKTGQHRRLRPTNTGDGIDKAGFGGAVQMASRGTVSSFVGVSHQWARTQGRMRKSEKSTGGAVDHAHALLHSPRSPQARVGNIPSNDTGPSQTLRHPVNYSHSFIPAMSIPHTQLSVQSLPTILQHAFHLTPPSLGRRPQHNEFPRSV